MCIHLYENGFMTGTRIDKWLWAARFYKTRELASKACELKRVQSNGQDVKPAREVKIGDTTLHARTVLWAAGVQASPIAKSLGAPLDRAGRVFVNDDLSLPNHPEVFVVGDVATLKTPVPGVAPAAIQEGTHAAKNIRRLIRGQPTLPFHYFDKGSLATIGRAAAVADFGKLHISGFFAWLSWLGVHIFFLIGFRNRVLVILQWAWAYVTFQRGARLITDRQ